MTKTGTFSEPHLHSARNDRLLVPVLNPQQTFEYRLLVLVWLLVVIALWVWWLQPQHIANPIWFVVNSAILVWVTIWPGYFLFMFWRGCVPNATIALPRSNRVAMVVTKAPSEPWPMVRETLIGSLRQSFPHDTWLADERPSDETMSWCAANGVHVSTRYGVADYHRIDWPRRTRCKEGNLAFFYDHYGYSRYDFVSQLDADHVPSDNYLEELMRPFVDPAVGYVSAPSICDRNAGASWSARSRLYVEGLLHGGLQIGYNGGFAPLCIGSHYAVRTSALSDIGGLGPELAEDHSTTMMMNAHGWRGVHAADAIAHGDGPETFADLATQEFQWSRSLTLILLKYTPKYFGGLASHLKFQFIMCQVWYPMFSVAMALSYVLPLIALARNDSFVNVTYPEFLLASAGQSLCLMLMGVWWQRGGFCRPYDSRVFSWEGALFLFARWPWSLAGVGAGLMAAVRGSALEFRITPKASSGERPLPWKVIVPYAALSLVSSLFVLTLRADNARGFYIFASINAIVYASILSVVVINHARETARRTAFDALRGLSGPVASCLGLVWIFALVAIGLRAQSGFSALFFGADAIMDLVR